MCSTLIPDENSTNLTMNGYTNCSESTAVPQSFSTIFIVVCGVIMVLMIAVSVMGNVIVCYIVYQKPAMRSAINLLLATLAMADVLTAVCCMPFALFTLIAQKWILGSVFCHINGLFYSFLVSESTLVLVTISIDRYLIIVRRKDTLTPQKAKVYIVASWVGAVLFAVPPIFQWGQYMYTEGQLQCSIRLTKLNVRDKSYGIAYFSFAFILPFAIMSYCYYCILRTVRRNSQRVGNHPPAAGAPIRLTATKINRPGRMDINYSFKTRAFTTILILFLLFVICCLPYVTLQFYMIFFEFKAVTPMKEISAVFLFLTYLNCTLKPVIYYWRIGKFREACFDIMPAWCLQIPKCLPGRAIRRIRPGERYKVDRKVAVSSM
ncbi:high-affinity lysophosphatidic acid receptor-like [Exaiptasia diaphana]|uniref:G-protein coupled receptors family 1 profile domain-containing protein n=1 Tax=Exaiptasia diaphana TaxID=2652724 RepID=A0A913WZW2_EXADI|nr:high-affinity lysophosphatidic acid receptor-like [Exaiptasia diaphana]